MSEYGLGFARKLAELAARLEQEESGDSDARRAVVYLSRLAVEVALKALLEQAGMPVTRIRAHSHKLSALLTELSGCEIECEITPGTRSWASASRLRAVTVELGAAYVTVGTLIDAEEQGASVYPNQVRYGSSLTDYPPFLLPIMAQEVVAFATAHWNTIRVTSRVE